MLILCEEYCMRFEVGYSSKFLSRILFLSVIISSLVSNISRILAETWSGCVLNICMEVLDVIFARTCFVYIVH